MGRRIITYPFNEKFHDAIVADAETIKDIKLPGAYVECRSIVTGEKSILSVKPVVFALEDEPGIHFYLVEEGNNNHDEQRKSSETVIDEIEFCNALYGAIMADITAEETEFIRNLITNQLQHYATYELTEDKWLSTIRYEGFGVIRSGEIIIGTIDQVMFNKDNLILDQCVGNVNLNKIVNCNIWFKSGNKGFKLSDITMDNVKSDNDYYCTYTLTGCKGEFLEDICIPEETYKSLVRFSEDTAEQFLAERINLLNDETEEENNSSSIYDDIL